MGNLEKFNKELTALVYGSDCDIAFIEQEPCTPQYRREFAKFFGLAMMNNRNPRKFETLLAKWWHDDCETF